MESAFTSQYTKKVSEATTGFRVQRAACPWSIKSLAPRCSQVTMPKGMSNTRWKLFWKWTQVSLRDLA